MKNIKNYNAEKYLKKGLSLFKKRKYNEVEPEIYEYKEGEEVLYVTSLSFEQEPEYEEGNYADDISQYPLEDLLDEFCCYISDFYEDLNVSDSKVCYLEFASEEIDDIKELRSIIGKHVYNKDCEEDGETYAKLVIEKKCIQ